MSKPKNNVNDLLAAIKRQTPEPCDAANPERRTDLEATQIEAKPKKKDEKPTVQSAAKNENEKPNR